MNKDGGCFVARVAGSTQDKIDIVSESPIKVGSLLTLETGDDWITAEACHCGAEGEGYRVGLSPLESVSKLDLRKLREALFVGQPEPMPSAAGA